MRVFFCLEFFGLALIERKVQAMVGVSNKLTRCAILHSATQNSCYKPSQDPCHTSEAVQI
ncbi:hypothetical protein [Endozoicomonas sp. ONNA2]|uniref:hypothetical protein n=1 Tax=Endozoicomonas sp. ONNA2 TaxID=2828741 RepID=UPI0021491A2F|nr:hypothetical protein [Endozoicomonas sp. ONNA2]